MDDLDDFGDLYADLDYNLSSGIGKNSCLDQSVPIDRDTMVSIPKEAESVSKEREINGRVEDMDGMMESSNNSDSDDDLHIVLNEDDCPQFQQSKGFGFGNGGVGLGGINDEDEGDNLVIGTVAERRMKDRTWSDRPVDPADVSMQGGIEKGSAVKSGRASWHVGSHLSGISNSGRTSASGKGYYSERTSASGKGNWDQLMMPCFAGNASYNVEMSGAAQNGGVFFLPRNRTIFDINIEVFEHKPWRHHGVDMTDYFNFGLDEESWKNYCECLDHFRQQAAMPTRCSFYQSSKLNQGKKDHSTFESVETRGWGFDRLKGRAIHVEGGLGERIPSTDIRRPRHRDSDVVIQIAMENSVEDASVLCKTSLEHAEEQKTASLPNSEDKSDERTFSLHHDGQISGGVPGAVEHGSPKVNEVTFERISGEVQSAFDCTKDDEEDPLIMDAYMSEAEFDRSDEVPQGSNSCNPGTDSEESKDRFPSEKDLKMIKKAPLRSVTVLQESIEADYNLSKSCRSEVSKPEKEDSKNNSRECNSSSGDRKHFRRTRLRSVAELNVSVENKQAYNLAYRKHQKDGDLGVVSYKTKERDSHSHADIRGRLSSYQETEVLRSDKSRMYAANHGSGKSCTKDSRKGDRGTHLESNLDEDCLKRRECYYAERRWDDRRTEGFPRKRSDQTLPEHESYISEKHSYLRPVNKGGDEHRSRVETEYDDNISGHKYRERHVQERRGSYISWRDGEKENYDLKFGRHAYFPARQVLSPRRNIRYDRRSCFDLNNSDKFTDHEARSYGHLDHGMTASCTHGVPSTIEETDWHYTVSPRTHSPLLWRLSERNVSHRGHSNTRELHFKNDKYGCAVRSSRNCRHSSYENTIDSDIDEYFSGGKGVYVDSIISRNKMRRHDSLPKARLHIDNDMMLHLEPGGLSSPERLSVSDRSSRHNKGHVNQQSVSGQTFPYDHQYDDALMRTEPKGSPVFNSWANGDFVSDISTKGRHEAALGCREAVDIHLNGWKGKLARRCSRVADESEAKTDTTSKITNELKNSMRGRKALKQREVLPHVPKGEDSRHHQKSFEEDKGKSSKAANLYDNSNLSPAKLRVSQDLKDDDIEEGELIEESDKHHANPVTLDWNSEKKVDGSLESKEKIVGVYDRNHILETLAKMEKRKERFKETITLKQVPEKSVSSQSDVPVTTTDEVKPQRPTRKRRWGGN